MCGFAGVFRPDGLRPDDGARVRQAAARLARRGPDGEGCRRDEYCALAFRRLAVIDPSPAGNQPLSNEDGGVWVVFNGEIYNHRELRGELEGRGHRFRGRCDTEILPHLYEEFGAGMLPRLRGMFAFVLYDAPRRRLFFARDPLGVKPLYFAERDGAFFFASEPAALFAFPECPPRLDPVALHDALTYRYVPPPRTGFRDLEKLSPGAAGQVENGFLRVEPWWTLPAAAPRRDLSLREALEETEAHLRAAVARRREADVPFGVWLSGGVDSALTAAEWAADAGSGSGSGGAAPSAFTVGFTEPEYDERPLAAATAAALGLSHEVATLDASLFDFLPETVRAAGEPFFDSSILPTWFLARESRRRLTVTLSGDGGDESFGGYERYLGVKLAATVRGLPRPLRSSATAAAAWAAGRGRRGGAAAATAWLERCAAAAAEHTDPDEATGAAYTAAMTLFDEEQKRRLYHPDFAAETAELDGREYLRGVWRLMRGDKQARREPAARLTAVDLVSYLPGDLLLKVDRASMAHGLEVRSPFLDVELVEWAASLPDRVRLPGFETKPLLRRPARRKKLPAEVARGRKRGFGLPLDEWFRGPLKVRAEEMFREGTLTARGIFRPDYWRPFWEEHQGGRAVHGERLYALLALETWAREFS